MRTSGEDRGDRKLRFGHGINGLNEHPVVIPT